MARQIEAALATASAYRSVGEEMKKLSDQEKELQGAQIAASQTGDREALYRIGIALDAIQLARARIKGTDPASVQAREEQAALERMHEEDSQKQRVVSIEQAQRRGIQQSGIGGIADPVERARAQLQFEQQIRLEDINNLKISQDEKDLRIAQSNELQLTRQRELNEHLKPEYEKNLEAWSNTNRLMRDNWNREMLAMQVAGEDLFVKFVTTGKLQIQDLARVIEIELARSLYRGALGAANSGGARGLFGYLFGGGSGGGGSSGGTVLPRGTSSNAIHSTMNLKIDARGADAGVETRIRAAISDEMPRLMYQHRRTLVALLNNHRIESGRDRL